MPRFYRSSQRPFVNGTRPPVIGRGRPRGDAHHRCGLSKRRITTHCRFQRPVVSLSWTAEGSWQGTAFAILGSRCQHIQLMVFWHERFGSPIRSLAVPCRSRPRGGSGSAFHDGRPFTLHAKTAREWLTRSADRANMPVIRRQFREPARFPGPVRSPDTKGNSAVSEGDVKRIDPRFYQITVLTALLTFGLTQLQFEIALVQVAATLAAALTTQAVAARLVGLRDPGLSSALISGLSLCLLLRTATSSWAVAGSRHRHRIEVRDSRSRQARLQSDQRRHRRCCCRRRRGLGVAGPVGERDVLRVSDGLPRHRGRDARRAGRRDVRVPRLLRRAAVRRVALARRAADDSAPSPRERRAAALRVLHDLGSEDDARLAGRTRALRGLVALGAWYVQFRLFRTNGLLWSLAVFSPLVPLIDRVLPARATPGPRAGRFRRSQLMKRWFRCCWCSSRRSRPRDRLRAFCGFYVAKADTKLFNQASQVVLVRDGDKTVMTMANDFKGDLKEFAVVIPVPTFLQKGADPRRRQGARRSSRRLLGAAARRVLRRGSRASDTKRMQMAVPRADGDGRRRNGAAARGALGVTIEAQYTVGEYDILILSAQESTGLETWLQRERLSHSERRVARPRQLPQTEHAVLRREGESERAGEARLSRYLRPLQVAYESPKFMLPIRLGMVNANGPQELFVYALTRNGRVETTNYRTVKLPTDMELPALREGGVRRLLQGDVQRAGAPRRHARGVHRVCVGHELVRPVRRRSAVARRAAGPRRLLARRPTRQPARQPQGTIRRPRPFRRRAARRTCSSRGCTSATTTRTSPRISCSRRPPTARTSRDATCCGTRGQGREAATRRQPTARNCRNAANRRRRLGEPDGLVVARHPKEDAPQRSERD